MRQDRRCDARTHVVAPSVGDHPSARSFKQVSDQVARRSLSIRSGHHDDHTVKFQFGQYIAIQFQADLSRQAAAAMDDGQQRLDDAGSRDR